MTARVPDQLIIIDTLPQNTIKNEEKTIAFWYMTAIPEKIDDLGEKAFDPFDGVIRIVEWRRRKLAVNFRALGLFSFFVARKLTCYGYCSPSRYQIRHVGMSVSIMCVNVGLASTDGRSPLTLFINRLSSTRFFGLYSRASFCRDHQSMPQVFQYRYNENFNTVHNAQQRKSNRNP